MSLLNFDDLARLRGDGLHPALRQLLERRQAISSDGRVADIQARPGAGAVQAGPNPQPQPGAFRPGNVIDFQTRAAETAADMRERNQAKGRS